MPPAGRSHDRCVTPGRTGAGHGAAPGPHAAGHDPSPQPLHAQVTTVWGLRVNPEIMGDHVTTVEIVGEHVTTVWGLRVNPETMPAEAQR
jgi:hypothetical protein